MRGKKDSSDMALNPGAYRVLIVNERDVKERTSGDSVHQYELLRALSQASAHRRERGLNLAYLSCDNLLDDSVRRLVKTVEFKKTPYTIRLVGRLLSEIKRSTVIYTREFNPIVAILSYTLDRPLVVEANGLWSLEFSLQSRGTLLSRCWEAWLRLDEMIVFRLATLVIAVTPYLRRAIIEDYGLSPQVVRFIPNAVDCERFSPETTALERFGSESNELKVILPSSFKVWHGADDLVKIAVALANRGIRAQFFLVGIGPTLASVLSKSRELGVGKMFVTLGPVPNSKMPELLRRADLCIYTPRISKYRARIGEYTIKVLEWMAAGKPIISYSVPGIDDLLGGGAGMLVPSGDVTGVVDAVMYLIRHPVLAKQLATEARRRACSYYDWNKVVDQISGVIEEARSKRPEMHLPRLLASSALLLPEMAANALRRRLRGKSTFQL